MVKNIIPKRTWQINENTKDIYLTFDDGPHATITNFVLDELKKYNAEATFFCIGKNVVDNLSAYERIINEGHAVGNHTQHHLNWFNTIDKTYIDDVLEASKFIDSDLFRPPYGRLKTFQANILTSLKKPYRIIMWSVLSGDFDLKISPERCLENVLFKISNGAIVVFHDSEKAAERMMYALPKVLKILSQKGYSFRKISGLSLD